MIFNMSKIDKGVEKMCVCVMVILVYIEGCEHLLTLF